MRTFGKRITLGVFLFCHCLSSTGWCQVADPFAPDHLDEKKGAQDSGVREFSFSVFAVPASKVLSRLIKGPDDSRIYREMVGGIADGSVKLIRQEFATSSGGLMVETSHSRSALSPWYYNLFHLDTIGRYNPRSTDIFRLPEVLTVDTNIGVSGETDCQFAFHYSPGRQVTRFYGAGMPEVKKDFPRFVELPAAPGNFLEGHHAFPLGLPEAKLIAVQQVYQPLPGKENGWEVSEELHLTFLKASLPRKPEGGDKEKAAPAVWIRAVVFEIEKDGIDSNVTFENLARNEVVAFTAASSVVEKQVKVASQATYMAGELTDEAVKPGKYEPVKDARGYFTDNLSPEPLNLGIRLLATAKKSDTGKFRLTYHLVFDPRAPRLSEVKLAYRDDSVDDRPFREAWFEQYEVFTESAKGSVSLSPGLASDPIFLKAVEGAKESNDGRIRIAFFLVSEQ